MKALERYLHGIRQKAEDIVFAKQKTSVQARRDHEKFMSGRGGGKFDDMTLQDIEILKKSGRYQLMLEEEGFQKRVQLLENEREGAVMRARIAGEKAVQRAAMYPPPAIELLDKQEKERSIFCQTYGIAEESVQDAPIGIKAAFRELVEKHEREIKEFKTS